MFITTINGKDHKVYFKHGREERTCIQKNGELGTCSHPVDTTCYFVDKSTNEIIVTGHTKCHPNERFEYIKGRKYALERAMDTLNLSRNQRGEVWMDYHSRSLR